MVETFVRQSIGRTEGAGVFGGAGATGGAEAFGGAGATGRDAALGSAGVLGDAGARGWDAAGRTEHRRALPRRGGAVRFAASAVLALAAGAVALALASHAWRIVGSVGYWRADDVVGLGVMALGAAIAAWYSLTGLGAMLALAVRRGLGVSRWGAPLARRLVIGLAFGLAGALPAAATSDLPDDLSLAGISSAGTRDGAALVDPDPSGDPAPEEAPAAVLPGDDSPAAAPGTDPAPAVHEGPASPVPPAENPAREGSTDGPAPTAEASDAERPGSSGTIGPASGQAGRVRVAALQTSAPPLEGPPARAASPAGTPAEPSATWHVVSPGESLWAISEAELSSMTVSDSARAGHSGVVPNAEIAVRVGEWIAANPGLAADPDLIHVGQVLSIPRSTS